MKIRAPRSSKVLHYLRDCCHLPEKRLTSIELFAVPETVRKSKCRSAGSCSGSPQTSLCWPTISFIFRIIPRNGSAPMCSKKFPEWLVLRFRESSFGISQNWISKMETPKLIGSAPLTVARLSAPAPAMAFTHLPGVPPSEASISLAHFLRILRRNAWKLAAFVTVVVLGALLVTLKLEKLYESVAVVKVDRPATRGIVGDEALQILPDNDLNQIITTQIEQIQSDPVIRPVAEKYHLLEVEKQLSGLTTAQASRRLAAPITLRGLKVT